MWTQLQRRMPVRYLRVYGRLVDDDDGCDDDDAATVAVRRERLVFDGEQFQ